MPNPTVGNQLNPIKFEFLTPVNASLRPLIQIFVRKLDGQTITTNVARDALVIEIMEQVAQKTEIPILEQRLQFAGKQLRPHFSIQEYVLQKENTLDLSLRLKGGVGEYQVVKDFIQARIVHGNVTRLQTKNSSFGVYVLDRHREQYEPAIKRVRFDESYANPELRMLCFDALAIEGFQSGNCDEMSKWVAVQLMENTKNQHIYVCGLKGTFPLKDDIAPDDTGHVLYDDYTGQVSNKLRHALVITYPKQVDSIGQMNPDHATVVDTWYDHLVCSLTDYMATMHPYYNYEFSSNPALSLQADNFRIKYRLPGVGKPFASSENKAQVVEVLKRFKAQIDEANISPDSPDLEPTEYDFDIADRVQDNRSLENLELLLRRAYRIHEQNKEVANFTPDSVAKIMQSSREDVLGIFFGASNQLKRPAFELLARELEQFSPARFDSFCRDAGASTLRRFFGVSFDDFESNPAFENRVDEWLSMDMQSKSDIVMSFSRPQLQYYALSAPARFVNILAVKSGPSSLKMVLRGIDAPAWEALFAGAAEAEINIIMNYLIENKKDRAAVAIQTLTPSQFNTYLVNLPDFSAFCSGKTNDVVLQAVFAQFRATGITHTDGTPDTALGQIYAQKLGDKYWAAYLL